MHPDQIMAVGTVALVVIAAVAIFQDSIHGWIYKPKWKVSCKTAPPDCVAGITRIDYPSSALPVEARNIYLRLWVENIGNATAKNAEVFASELRRQCADQSWELVKAFPPMNLKWANIGAIYFPMIAPCMGKHCDLGHISDPEMRHLLGEYSTNLGVGSNEASLAFDVMVAPYHLGHIIGRGDYELDVLVAAENARPIKKTIALSLTGTWDADGDKMLRDNVGMRVLD